MSKLSHVDNEGKANMVDVGNKPIQERMARARGKIKLQAVTIAAIRENNLKKGDVLTVANIAGIQAAKRTAELIPLCHPLMLNKVEVKFELGKDEIVAESQVKCNGQTGVEMEALTAVSTALLTIYDMCKAIDKSMEISQIQLVEKTKK